MAANGGGTHSSVFSVDINGNIVTSNTATNGHIFYNTTDQTTNYARVRHYFSSGNYYITNESGGTGVRTPIIIGNLLSTQINDNLSGSVQVSRSTGNGYETVFGILGNTTISSGNYNGIGILNNVINTSTGVYTGSIKGLYVSSECWEMTG